MTRPHCDRNRPHLPGECPVSRDRCGYDPLQPHSDIFFEIKWQDNLVTGKPCLHLPSQPPVELMSYRRIGCEIESVMPDGWMRDFLRYSDAILIVQYDREYFVTDDGRRIMLDSNITYYDQTGRQRISTSFPRRLEGLVVRQNS